MRIDSPAGAQRVRQGARSADAGAPAPSPNCATQDVRRRNTALPALAWTWPFFLAACAPGERLGVLEQGVCVCPELDAGAVDAGDVDAGAPDASPHVWRKVHYLADSIPIVGASDVAHRAVTLIKASYPGEFFDQAVGGRSLHFYAHSPERRAYIVDAIRTRPTQPPSEVWIALGYNDWAGAPWTAHEYGMALRDFADRLRTEIPGVLVICQSPHFSGNRLNGRGETLEQFIISMTFAGCDQFVDGRGAGIERPGDFSDTVHLNDAGHAKWAAFSIAAGGW